MASARPKRRRNVPNAVSVRITFGGGGKVLEARFDRITAFRVNARRDLVQLRPRKGDTQKRFKAAPTQELVLRVVGRQTLKDLGARRKAVRRG